MPNVTSQKSAEAVWATWPCNVSAFGAIATSTTSPIAYRVSRITIAMEPATASSTQMCGLMNCDVGNYSTGTGFGDIFKRWRTCNVVRRSTPGGNIEVSWPCRMPFLHISDATKSSTAVPQIFLGLNDSKALSSGTAWAEMMLEVEYITAA